MFAEFVQRDAALLARCGLRDSLEVFLPKAEALAREVLRLNALHNLTRITEPEPFWTRHILDSLLGATALPGLLDGTLHGEVLDIGCGGGFPCLPLALANPSLRITGMDSEGTKVDSVREAAKTLGLHNLQAVKDRAREAGRKPEFAGRFAVITARAVAETGELIPEVRKMLAPGGLFFLYKTPEAVEKEMVLAKREAAKAKLELSFSDIIDLGPAGKRQFVSCRAG